MKDDLTFEQLLKQAMQTADALRAKAKELNDVASKLNEAIHEITVATKIPHPKVDPFKVRKNRK